MQTMLCIEDTDEVQILVRRTFANSIQVVPAKSLSEAYEKLRTQRFDLVLLDLTLPDGDGFQFFNKLTEDQSYQNLPVIILTSKNQIQDKILGFHLGAEDYIVKPFDPAELKIRVETRLKRHQQINNSESILHYGNLTINHLEQKVTITTGSLVSIIDLTTTEFKILSYLAKLKEQVLSREQIINATWKHGFHISDRTIDSHVSRIRKKIAESQFTIQATQSVGYKFCENNKYKAKKAS